MGRFRIGTLSGNWANFVPPIQGGNFSASEEENDPTLAKTAAIGAVAFSEKEKASPLLPQQPVFLTPDEHFTQAIQDDINESTVSHPSLDAATQDAITEKFQTLHQVVTDQGYYDCDYYSYGIELLRYSALFAAFFFSLRYGWYALSGLWLGLFWQQIMFTAHDAGHRGITHNFVIDTLIGIFIGDFCCGLSIGWWKSSHNVHHLVTNSPVCTLTVSL